MINTAEVVQSCLARSDSIKIGRTILQRIKHQLYIFDAFSCCLKYFQLFERCFPFISLSPSHFYVQCGSWQSAASNFFNSVKYTRAATQYQLTFFVATSIERIADTVVVLNVIYLSTIFHRLKGNS